MGDNNPALTDLSTKKINHASRSNTSIDVKLDNENFSLWHFLITPMLLDEGLATESIDPKNPGLKIIDSAGALRALTNNVDIKIAQTLIGKTKASEVWALLLSKFQGKSLSRLLRLLTTLATFRCDPHQMDAEITRFTGFVRDLRSANGGENITIETLAVALLLNALPESFESLRTVLENSSNDLTVDHVVSKIHEKEDSMRCREPNDFSPHSAQLVFKNQAALDAHIASENAKKYLTKCSHGRHGPKCWACHPDLAPACRDCGQKGHRHKRNNKCAKHEKANYTHTPTPVTDVPSSDEPDAWIEGHAFACVERELAASTWNHKVENESHGSDAKTIRFIADSGASTHFISNKKSLANYRAEDSNASVANGGSMKIAGRGSLKLENGELTNVLHCPELSHNLLSISNLCDKNNTVTFTKSGCIARSNESGKIIMSGVRQGSMYICGLNLASTALMAARNNKPCTLTDLWHRRLGHISHKSLRLLAHISTGITLDSNPTDLCEPCAMAKSHREPFPPSLSRASRKGELTHSDLSMFETPSLIGGHRYICEFVDDNTRLMTIYLLKTKDQTFDAFKEYDMRIYNLTGRHTSTLRCDGGGEFMNTKLKQYCIEHGIRIEPTTPHTPELNARAERPNRTIEERIIAMIQMAKVHKSFWAWAALTACYLYNRTPHSALHRQTPFEAWSGNKPDLSNLRVLGTRCFVHVPKKTRQKLDPKSKPMTLIGYAPTQKAWKLLDHENKREVLSRHVIFGNEIHDYPQQLTPDDPIPPIKVVPYVEPKNFETTNPFAHLESEDIDERPEESIEPLELPKPSLDAKNAKPKPSFEYEPIDTKPKQDIMGGPKHTKRRSVKPPTAEQVNLAFDQPLEEWALAILAEDAPKILSWKAALQTPLRESYVAAKDKEYASLKKFGVFSSPLPRPSGKRIHDTKLILRQKETESPNEPPKCKARLCLRGFSLIEGVDYHESYAPVAAMNSLRVFLSYMASIDYELDNVDVDTAFLHSELKEEIYVEIPEGYTQEPHEKGMVLRLLKNLYGSVQGPCNWNKDIDALLVKLGFKATISDRCIYKGTFNGKLCFILLYVDDMILSTPDPTTTKALKKSIHDVFPITDNGPLTFFLNMRIQRNRADRTLSISQTSKISALLKSTNMTQCAPAKIPADANIILTHDMSPTSVSEITRMKSFPYKQTVGRLLYIAVTARPDISTAVSAVGKFAQNPGQSHWDAVLRIIKYLKGTQDYTLTLTQTGLETSTTADLAQDT
jgi:hypothetical protein